MPTPLLILASRSPRRAALLREAGYPFVQDDPPFHDPPQPEQTGDPAALARLLAAMKALSLRDARTAKTSGVTPGATPGAAPGGVILAADTLCVDAHGRVVGQPADREDARRILSSFMGSGHRVITGVALLGMNDAHPDSFSDAAEVRMHRVPDGELETYLDTQQWRGKAGAYNLFDRRDAGWVIDVHGDPSTVVGLPMKALVPRLASRGLYPLNKPVSHHELFQA